MLISREWAMPNSNTFNIKPVKKLLDKYLIKNDIKIIDPFANNSKLANITNDLDPQYDTDYHLDALDFLKLFDDNSIDIVLYDPPYCYDEETQVFTKQGWKYFIDVLYEDEIATLNTDTNMLEYQKPIEVIKKRYTGKMIQIDSQSINLLVTPYHRMWIKNEFYGDYNFENAIDILDKKKIWFQKSCNYEGKEEKYFYLPEVLLNKPNRYGEKIKPIKKINMDVWLKFLGLFLAEGCTKTSMDNKHKYVICISQKKKEIRKIIKKVLDELGYNYHIQPTDFILQDKQLWTYLSKFGKSGDRYIPEEIKNLSKRQLKILLDHLMYGDGTNKRYNKFNKQANQMYHYTTNSYYTSSIKLMNDFSELAIKCGYGITISEKDQKTSIGYAIHLLKSDHFKVCRENIQEINNFDGYIYCLSVPNTTLLVKRKNRICWCGNSPRQISECYKKLNKSVNMQTTQASYWSNQKKEIGRILKPGGKVITCSWNSGGIGKKYGLKIIEVLLVPHGGWHNDTIITVEEREGDDILLIDNYPKDSDLTLLNTIYVSPKKIAEKKWDNGYLQVVYKDNVEGKKKKIEIENPEYVYYMSKDEIPVDHNLLFTHVDNLNRKVVPFRGLEKQIADDTGNTKFFFDNIRNGNRDANKKLHSYPTIFFSDMNLEDNYRWRFSNYYQNNTIPITKSFFDIEADTIDIAGDFPELGEAPINAITIILEQQKKTYTLLLRNSKNPLIEQFEKSINKNTFVELKDFIRNKVGGWKNEIRFGLKDMEYEFLFYNENAEIQLIADLFKLINLYQPDFMLAWNMRFDIPYIIERIKKLGFRPEDIMCHPDFITKHVSYYTDERADIISERGDYAKISSYSTFIDQMNHFAGRRKGRKEFSKFNLDIIGEQVAKVRKYDYSHITAKIAMLPYLDYKVFVFYNIMDTIVQKCIEKKSNDVEYLFNKCLLSNTRYQKGHRQTVYLINRARKEFYKDGFILGNNINKFNSKPDEKFPGAFVANINLLSPELKKKINGRAVNIIDNLNDFDFSSLYPSINREFNIAHNTQIGRIIIEQAIYANENRYKDDKWHRSIEFIEAFQSHVWLEFGTRWLALADYATLYKDIMEYYMKKRAAIYVPYNVETKRTELLYKAETPQKLLYKLNDNELVPLLRKCDKPDLSYFDKKSIA